VFSELTVVESADKFEEMDVAYFKRFRMEMDLCGRDLTPAPVAGQYHFVPWEPSLLEAFARAKYLSFRGECDVAVFPCLAEFEGCRRLMTEIAKKPGFLPGATWLAIRCHTPEARPELCGTVQGVRDRRGVGAIQNLGVVPKHRRSGLGAGLLMRALAGFRQAGACRAYLEVTAQNNGAIRLYRRAGFTTVKVVYKTAEGQYVK
jgi:ribosomal protein S18 acetylase RimI-like enzyme